MNNMTPEPLERDELEPKPEPSGQEALGQHATGASTLGDWKGGVWGPLTKRERDALRDKTGWTDPRDLTDEESKDDTGTENAE